VFKKIRKPGQSTHPKLSISFEFFQESQQLFETFSKPKTGSSFDSDFFLQKPELKVL